MVRYADDAVLVFSDGSEAERVLKALGERCSEYGLRLHPEKTRLVSFRRPPRPPGGGGPGRGSRPGPYDFLRHQKISAMKMRNNLAFVRSDRDHRRNHWVGNGRVCEPVLRRLL
jgi:hypothetical protein